MTFENEYNKIKAVVKQDFDCLEKEIASLFVNKNPLDKDLNEFLTAPAKRLRPLIGFLFSRAFSNSINKKQQDVLLAIELIHNATLIHDDVIDRAEKRRDKETLNIKFDDNLAVVAGDLMISVAMEKIVNIGSIDVLKLCSSAIKSTCLGEISQYFSKFKIPSIDEYIDKSKKKTALLFELAVVCPLLLSDKQPGEDLLKASSEFAQNFGIAFQIRDDLINVKKADSLDIKSGIYTAPVIFASETNKNILQEENLLHALDANWGIAKTKDLIDNYFNKADAAIQMLEDSSYKSTIVSLTALLRENF